MLISQKVCVFEISVIVDKKLSEASEDSLGIKFGFAFTPID